MKHPRLVFALLALASGMTGPLRADDWQPLPDWRIEVGRVAPWAEPGTKVDAVYRGKQLRFDLARLAGPHPLACEAGTTYEWLFGGPEGLFEGNLPAPQADAARRLDLAGERVPTLRVSCPNAGFDFHLRADGALLLGLDNVVWTLHPLRSAREPAEIVQALLLAHFTHDMGFTPASVALKAEYLSAALRARISAYFALPASPDDVPPIDGDPFTDTQEYPDRFTLDATHVAAGRTVVPVHFADEHTQRRVDYVLVREGERWVVDDVRDERGGSMQALLGEAAGR